MATIREKIEDIADILIAIPLALAGLWLLIFSNPAKDSADDTSSWSDGF